jgi:quercetin dioxygenase-like cupin family protein
MTRPREKSVKARGITSPVLSVNVDEEIARLKREPEWTSGRADSIALVKYPRMRVVLATLRKGTSMRQRKVEGPLSIYVISGKINVSTEKADHQVPAKSLFTMRQRFLNEVHAITDAVFLLTMFKIER